MVKRKNKRRLKKGPLFVLFLLLSLSVYYIYSKFFNIEPIENNVEYQTQKEIVDVLSVDNDVRNIAVMINNHPKARPYMSGLNDAFLVYEILVEGGYTRYMAVFNDKKTEKIGSVRSARHYFLDYALENDAVYVHCLWSEGV